MTYNPADYFTTGTSVKVWYDPTTPANCLNASAAPCADGEGCKDLLDSTSNDYDATQATSGNRPILRTNTYDTTLSTMEFNNRYMDVSDLNAVVKNVSKVALGALFRSNTTLGTNSHLFRIYDASYSYNRVRMSVEAGKAIIRVTNNTSADIVIFESSETVTEDVWVTLLFELDTTANVGRVWMDNTALTNVSGATLGSPGAIANTNGNEARVGLAGGDFNFADYFIATGEFMDTTQRGDWHAAVLDKGVTATLEVWANSGEDKVTQYELRLSNAEDVTNDVWDGTTISLWGAKNEVLGTALILEAPTGALTNVSVVFDTLTGPGGAVIDSTSPADPADPFNYVGRPIELFHVRYLQILGLSRFSYDPTYDERHVPERFRRPHTGPTGTGDWEDRPDYDKYYPEIAVPMEVNGDFTIADGTSQMVWIDIYIPDDATAGTYTGDITISADGITPVVVPVTLLVKDFALPDVPSQKTMLYLEHSAINDRYLGFDFASDPGETADVIAIRNVHYKVAHRHKISLIEQGEQFGGTITQPPAHLVSGPLDGTLFSAANGYDGPGQDLSTGIYSFGTYGVWQSLAPFSGGITQSEIEDYADDIIAYMDANLPDVERLFYLTDEPAPSSGPEGDVQTWAEWINDNPGIGAALKSFCTIALDRWDAATPDLDIPASWAPAMPEEWGDYAAAILADATKKLMMYNGKRPATGSFATEDDGIALRVVAWTQYKMQVHRWFYWNAAYYYDNQFLGAHTNVWTTAKTIGETPSFNATYGMSSSHYSNGDGVLFYPGTDTRYPSVSLGMEGPAVSLRMKLWRRGIQDADYLTLAAAIDPDAVDALVEDMVPSVLWENGVTDPMDPSYVVTDISWDTDPAVWEAARLALCAIIEGAEESVAGTSFLISYPDIPVRSLAYSASTTMHSRYPMENIFEGEKYAHAIRSTNGTSIVYTFDLGAGNAAAVDHFIMGNANLIQTVGNTVCKLQGSADGSTWVDQLGTTTDFGSWALYGYNACDTICTPDVHDDFGASLTAYRYWKFTTSGAGSHQQPISKLYFGTFWNPGVEPSTFLVEMMPPDYSGWKYPRGHTVLADGYPPIHRFTLEWDALPDDVTTTFRENVMQKSTTSYVWIYCTTYQEIIQGFNLVYCRVLSEETTITKIPGPASGVGANNIVAVFEQVPL